MNSLSAPKNFLYDVIIIGGGPAGSTAASWLSKSGRKTLVIEREVFPRFHIGESLLPNGNGVLKEIGVWDKIVAADFIKKHGAEFTVPDRSIRVRNVFAKGIVPGMEQAFQVERARFDEILLRHAESLGAEVLEQTSVLKTGRKGAVWSVETENVESSERKTFQAKWVIDASGRSCVMGRRLGISKEAIPYPGRFAVFNHFENVPRSEGKEGGDIIILRLKDAWFWVIPISDRVTSIGVVGQKGSRSSGRESLEAFFWRKVGQSSWLSEALEGATPMGNYKIESDYCFAYESYGKDQVLLAGDAASFIDPVFSSGVYLALESGLLAAKTIDATIDAKESNYLSIYKTYTNEMKQRVVLMRQLIESYYDNKSFEVFMTPKPHFKIPEAVNSILAGCTLPPFAVKWRFWFFRKICKIQKKHSIVPSIHWRLFSMKKEKGDPSTLAAQKESMESSG